MKKGVKVSVVRVFVNNDLHFGNPVGIIVDEKRELTDKVRHAITLELGFSECVFISDAQGGNVSIFNPQGEIDFAGHALVGTAYYLNSLADKHISSLVCRTDSIQTWQDGGLTWIRAGLTHTPPWHHEQLSDVESVDAFSLVQAKTKEHTMIWAWLDESTGLIRARTFAPDWGNLEDEANGSGAMQLATTIKKGLEIHHGKGSVIYAKPAGGGLAEVGGRVVVVQSVDIRP